MKLSQYSVQTWISHRIQTIDFSSQYRVVAAQYLVVFLMARSNEGRHVLMPSTVAGEKLGENDFLAIASKSN